MTMLKASTAGRDPAAKPSLKAKKLKRSSSANLLNPCKSNSLISIIEEDEDLDEMEDLPLCRNITGRSEPLSPRKPNEKRPLRRRRSLPGTAMEIAEAETLIFYFTGLHRQYGSLPSMEKLHPTKPRVKMADSMEVQYALAFGCAVPSDDLEEF